MEPIVIEFQLTKSEFLYVLRRELVRRKNFIVTMILYGIVALIGVALMAMQESSGIFFILVGVVSPLYFIFLVYRMTSRIWNRTPGIEGTSKIVISETGIESTQSYVGGENRSIVEWSQYRTSHESQDFFLIRGSQKKARLRIIPKKAFSSEVDLANFREILERFTVFKNAKSERTKK